MKFCERCYLEAEDVPAAYVVNGETLVCDSHLNILAEDGEVLMAGRARDYFEANDDGEGWADYQEAQQDEEDVPNDHE